MTTDEFLVIWARWDERPGDDTRARAMENACAELAASVSVTTTGLRRGLASARRSGRTSHGALALAIGAEHHRV